MESKIVRLTEAETRMVLSRGGGGVTNEELFVWYKILVMQMN